MTAQQVFAVGQQGLFQLLLVAGPLLLSALVVGLVISIFQAATQINEATLSGAGPGRPVDDDLAGGIPARHPVVHSEFGGLSGAPVSAQHTPQRQAAQASSRDHLQ